MSSVVLQVVVGILLVFLGSWFTEFYKRPKLQINGSGGGGGVGPGFSANHVGIVNEKGFLGIKLGELVIFGLRIHGAIEKGLRFDRHPATCRAWLIDKASKRTITILWWQPSESFDHPQQKVTIASGERCDFYLFARRWDEHDEYFVYSPDSGPTLTPRMTKDTPHFQDERTFVVRLTDFDGHKRMEFDISVQRDFTGKLMYRFKDGGGGGI